MLDVSSTIEPTTDQLNADSLLPGPRTIKVTKVSLCAEPDQPIAINFEGDDGKPYKPGKSMRRVLVHVWGKDGNAYIGRSMTLFRDEKVQFGGLAVGGIRISHMSHIDQPMTMALTATKKSRKPFTVKPLVDKSHQTVKPNVDSPRQPLAMQYDALRDEVDEAIMNTAKTATLAGIARGEELCRPLLQRIDEAGRADLKNMLVAAFIAARERVEPSDAAEPQSMEMGMPE